MIFGNVPLMDVMQQKLKYHAARQSVLAQNIANVDSPKYLTKDIKSPDFAAMLSRSNSSGSMAMTNARHMQPGMGLGGGIATATDRANSYELNPIGNNVVIEEETMRVAENQAEYQKILAIYRKSLEMFKIALGRPSGG